MGPFLTGLAALGFAATGVAALASPRRLARAYGLPATDAANLPYVRALGSRDLVLGLLLILNIARRAPAALMADAVALFALVGACDFTIVATTPNAKRSALTVHAAGTAYLILVWRFLRPNFAS